MHRYTSTEIRLRTKTTTCKGLLHAYSGRMSSIQAAKKESVAQHGNADEARKKRNTIMQPTCKSGCSFRANIFTSDPFRRVLETQRKRKNGLAIFWNVWGQFWLFPPAPFSQHFNQRNKNTHTHIQRSDEAAWNMGERCTDVCGNWSSASVRLITKLGTMLGVCGTRDVVTTTSVNFSCFVFPLWAKVFLLYVGSLLTVTNRLFAICRTLGLRICLSLLICLLLSFSVALRWRLFSYTFSYYFA